MPLTPSAWKTKCSDFELTNTAAHIWKVPLDLSQTYQIKLWRLLNNDEKNRARKFKFIHDKAKFIITRGTLRILLGEYLRKGTEDVLIEYEDKGKPFVKSVLEFNVSHSHNAAAIGFNLKHLIGVDIEYKHRTIEFAETAHRFFSAKEADIVMNSHASEISTYFYNCWTRKEAFIKALGDGLSFPLDKFAVTCNPSKKPELYWIEWNEMEKDNWQLASFNIKDDYIGAVAIKGPRKRIEYYNASEQIINFFTK